MEDEEAEGKNEKCLGETEAGGGNGILIAQSYSVSGSGRRCESKRQWSQWG